MKILQLEHLQRYHQNLLGILDKYGDQIKDVTDEVESLKSEEITREKLDQAVQNALDKAESALQSSDIASDLASISANKADADKKIADLVEDLRKLKEQILKADNEQAALDESIDERITTIEGIISGNSEAIEQAKSDIGSNAQALANAKTNIETANSEITGIKSALAEIDTTTNLLSVSSTTAAADIQALKDRADAAQTTVEGINSSLVTAQTALSDLENNVAKINADLAGVSGLAETQEKVQAIEQIVDALETKHLVDYVAVNKLEDGIDTVMVKRGVYGEDQVVNFYTKSETANKISTELAAYTKNADLSTTLTNYYTKEETPEQVKMTMFGANILSKDGENNYIANVYTKTETANQIASSLASYTDNVLTNYSTIAATTTAITTAVGDLNMGQYSTKNQTASAIETALAHVVEEDDLKNYYTQSQTADYVTNALVGYAKGDLANYSTTTQTNSKISEEIGKVENNLVTNYYNKTATADLVDTTLKAKSIIAADGTTNVYTKENTYNKQETADLVKTTLKSKNLIDDKEVTNVYTKSEAADMVRTTLYDKNILANDKNNNEIVNVYTKEETAAYVNTQIEAVTGTNLQNYYTRTETADAVKEILRSVQLLDEKNISNVYTKDQTVDKNSVYLKENVYTKTETAEQVKTQLVSNNLVIKNADGTYSTNVFTKGETYSKDQLYTKSDLLTKTETAQAISTELASYVKGADLEETLLSYSTTEQTSDALKAHLKKIGATDENDALILATAEELSTAVMNSEEGISSLNQRADSISSTVAELNENNSQQYTSIVQLKDAIGLRVVDNVATMDQKKIISAINLGTNSTSISGEYVHITGDTVFDDDVTIKGNMTAGTISCDKGVNINAGGLSVTNKGITIPTPNSNGSMVLDGNGMNFKDSTGAVFSQLGRVATGTCEDGQTVNLGWDVAPKMVMVSPRTIKTVDANAAATAVYLQCYADNYAVGSFKAHCYTTIDATTNKSTVISAKELSVNRTNAASNYSDVTVTIGSTATATLPEKASQTYLTGTITFKATGTTPTGNFASATNSDLTVLPGSVVTATVTPDSAYKVDSVTFSTPSGTPTSNNTYKVTMGAHPNASVTLTADRGSYTDYGFSKAYIDIIINNAVYKTITAYSGVNVKSYKYTLSETVSHASAAQIYLRFRGTYNYLASAYQASVGTISGTSVVPTSGTVVSQGSMSYIAFG